MNAWVALVTIASILVYFLAGLNVGRARGRFEIAAPSMTGHPEFERYVRIQANALEWMVIYLPCLWLCAIYADARVAAGLGVVWIVGRVLYARGYAREPGARSTGFLIQALATVALMLGALGGAILSLV